MLSIEPLQEKHACRGFEGPNSKDYSILGSTLGSSYFEKKTILAPATSIVKIP